jgi:hypothetical protein
MKIEPIGTRAVGRREFLGVAGTSAVMVAAAPLAATTAKASSENSSERTKPRYMANSPDIKAFYRVNRYPSQMK